VRGRDEESTETGRAGERWDQLRKDTVRFENVMYIGKRHDVEGAKDMVIVEDEVC
jgi:hypothetical protein